MSLNQEAKENRYSDHSETLDSIQLAQTTHNPSTYSDIINYTVIKLPKSDCNQKVA